MQPKSQLLTKHGEGILDILRGLAGWSSWVVIADQMDKTRLNDNDIAALVWLVAHGVIEARKAEGGSGRRGSWEYRVIESEERETTPDMAQQG